MTVGLTHATRAAGDDPPSVADHPAIAPRRGHEVAATSIGPLNDETIGKYREAGEVFRTVSDELAEMVEPGATHLEVAEYVKACTRGLVDGCTFPVNISINEEASHASPGRDDDTVFGGDMVCLDVDVHIDGYIADFAVIVDLSGNDELVESAGEAPDVALDMVETGTHTREIGTEIEDVIRDYDYTPVLNLLDYGVEQWDIHIDPTTPNRGAECDVELEVDDVVVIEPLTTDGTGKVTEGSKNEIYSLVNDRSVRDRMPYKLLDEVCEEYKLLPFVARWFEGGCSKMAIRRLEQQGILRGYPVLKEEDGTMVGQAEDTIIVIEDGYENLT